MISVRHAVPRKDVLLGIVCADSIQTDQYPSRFGEELANLLTRRRSDLAPDEEARRAAARDILRNGRYRPTGRGKPASEYLLRAAAADDIPFPRINAPVDVCNYLSLKHVIPISLWDVDLAETDNFVFRLGQAGEAFVFNEGGQTIDVEDLLVGCRVREDGVSSGEPIVNPVKDSFLTKTTPSTERIAACVYAPASTVTREGLESICSEFAGLLAQCGSSVGTAHAVLSPDDSVAV